MSFAENETIFRRVEEALAFDLLGGAHSPSTQEEQDADSAINSGLTPLYDTQQVETVQRYAIDPNVFGDLYLEFGGSGMVVGYSFGSQTRQQPETLTQAALSHEITVEVTAIRIIDGLRGVIEDDSGFALDKISDDIQTILQGDRRGAPDFGTGVQTFTLGAVNRLEGGATDSALWTGRSHNFLVRRSMRDKV